MVELDHEAMPRPVCVDGQAADRIVVDRLLDVPRGQPRGEVTLALAARMRHAGRLRQRPGARLAAPVARECAQVMEGDEAARCHVVRHAADRPADRREVEEGLGWAGDAQAAALDDLEALRLVHVQRLVPAPPSRRHDFGDLADW
jgi:hypothetical protein